ncbi:RusA family crossover junction endodeoxyribonuclease [Actinomadura nitritigenes]|uniref:RusA family crossover junction endodeoxyribonuclease n=1 Tax=Actinomadura nitritigenes TaxID=134602 RepID=UPI003D89EAAD
MRPVTFTAFGDPAGQGNLSRGRHGKSYHSNGAELEEWRTRVRNAAARATGHHALVVLEKKERTCAQCGTFRTKHGLFLGPVALDAVVAIARPPSVKRPYPTSRRHSDWDHHARALCDALTGLIYPDDSQVVDGHVRQLYIGHPSCPLPQPGALITVSEVS